MELTELEKKKKSLQDRYKELIEEAYNWRQSDSALSDFSEYKALKLLDELNHLKFLVREPLNNTN
ncbi:MAG: Lacal_2735 family protein [Bacteroidia bacterium]|nr:Lacal_2735 family protein [Bacteroidia bacterium]MBT8269425.1 Lacal_2735 family protein [Bacteroidia bacterium]NNF81475.1 Lacal_2735 family protein [Flavobacteriaceae bacterium]NNK70710.1 Lacal_2735 family protein [Flavobacteriaceae bacterium]NNL80046.1 Lacal_2735 family protein [Flavobacteriaceae bacterium]